MNTAYFKYAVEVDKTRSITQAAENLFMAQPNLSKAIKELEDSLGIVIFKRNSKGVTPTQKGLEFLEYAKNVLMQLDKMEALALEDHERRQRIQVAVPNGACAYLAEGVARFISAMSHEKMVHVAVKTLAPMETIHGVGEGTYSFGILRCPSNYERAFVKELEARHLAHDVIWEFDQVILMAKEHPLATVPEITQEMLMQYAEIMPENTTLPWQDKPEERKAATERISLDDGGMQFAVLSAAPWVYMRASPVSERVLSRFGLSQRHSPLPDDKYKDLLIYPKNDPLSDLERHLIDCLYAAKSEAALRTGD